MTVTLTGQLDATVTALAPQPDVDGFVLKTTAIEVIDVAGTTTDSQDRDSKYTTHTGATSHNNYQGTNTPVVPGTDIGTITYESSDESVATVDANGLATRVSDGTATITATGKRWNQAKSLDFSQTSPSTVKAFTGFVSGSLAYEACDSIDTLIDSLDADSTTLPIWKDGALNTSCWAYAVDNLLAQSISNPSCIAVNSRFGLSREHYPPGSTVKFAKTGGGTYTATILDSANVGPSNSSDGYATDAHVVLFSEALPTGVELMPVIPDGFKDYVPGVANGIAGIKRDQDNNMLVADLTSLASGFANLSRPTDSQRQKFAQTWISGDSGSGFFLVLNGKAVLVMEATFGGAGSGDNIAVNIDAINAVMATLATDNSVAGTWTLDEADLSGYTDYSWGGQWAARQQVFATQFDETTGTTCDDLSGNGNDGTYVGGVTLDQQGPLGDDDKAARFDGSDDFVVIPDDASLRVQQFSLSAVVTPDAVNNNRTLLWKGRTTGTNLSYGLRISDGVAEANLFTTSAKTVTGSISVDTNSHWILATYDGSTLKLFVDAVNDGSLAVAGTIAYGAMQAAIASKPNGAVDLFDGSMSDVRILSEALTPQQISDLYAASGLGDS